MTPSPQKKQDASMHPKTGLRAKPAKFRMHTILISIWSAIPYLHR